MRVLKVISALTTGGAEKLLTESVPLYQKAKVNVDVLVLQNAKTLFRKQLESQTNGKIIGLTSKSIYNPVLIFKIIPYFKNYDVIHVHLFPALYWVVLAKCISFTKVPIIYTEHSTNNKRKNYFFFRFLDGLIYSRLNHIGCISDGVFLELNKYLKKITKKSIINNGLDIKKFNNIKIDKKKYNFFSEKDIKLIQVSSFRKPKDQETVINALLDLPSNIKLLLVGDGPLRKEREIQVEKLNLTDRVIFFGNRYDVPEMIMASDIVILSSNYEGFGLAILEGMAASKPVIASNVVGLKGIVENHGLLFDNKNSRDLANKIKMLSSNKSFYNEIALKCYQKALEFDINNMVKEYIKLYEKVLEENS